MTANSRAVNYRQSSSKRRTVLIQSVVICEYLSLLFKLVFVLFLLVFFVFAELGCTVIVTAVAIVVILVIAAFFREAAVLILPFPILLVTLDNSN